MSGSSADQGVFHDDGVLADTDFTILSCHHSTVKDPCPCTDYDCPGHDRSWSDIGGRVDRWVKATMFNQHYITLVRAGGIMMPTRP